MADIWILFLISCHPPYLQMWFSGFEQFLKEEGEKNGTYTLFLLSELCWANTSLTGSILETLTGALGNFQCHCALKLSKWSLPATCISVG